MDKDIIDILDSMDDDLPASSSMPSQPSPPPSQAPKEETGLNTPVFKKLGEILYDTIVKSTQEYVAETEAKGKDVLKAMEKSMAAGIPIEYYDDMSLKPELTDIQQQIADATEDTIHDTRMQALKDPVTVAGTVAAGVTGSPFLLPLVTSPFIAHDLAKATKQGQGGKATANLALPIMTSAAVNMLGSWGKLAKFAPGVSKVLQNPMTSALAGTGAAMTDEQTRQWAIEHPGRAGFLFAGVDAIRGGKKAIKTFKGETEVKTTPTEAPVEPQGEPVMANKQPKVDKYGFEETDGMVKPKETPQPTKERTLTEEAFPENTKENVKAQEEIVNNITEEVVEAQRTPSVMQGAYDEKLTFGTDNLYDGQVSINGIWKAAQKVAPALPSRFGRKAKEVLGYFKTNTEEIRVRGFTSWSTLCHETGHALSKKTGFGRGNPAIEAELKNGALSIWKNGEYGDSSTPKGHSTYIEEGRAAFMNEYLINPEMAKKHFPLTYADLEARLGQDGILKAQVDVLGQQIRKWGNENHWGQVNSTIDYGLNKPFMERFNKAMLDVETATVDELAPLYQVTKDFLMQNPTTKMDKNGNIKTTKRTIPMEENPGHIAQRAKEAINSVTNCLMGYSGIDTPLIMQAVANKVGVSLHSVTMMDVYDPLRRLSKKLDVKAFTKSENIKDWYEGFSTYVLSKHTLEVIKVKNEQRIKNLETYLTDMNKRLSDEAKAIADDKAKGIDVTARETTWRDELKRFHEIEDKKIKIEQGLDDYLTPEERSKYEKIVADGDAIPELVEATDLLRKFNENVLRIAVAGDMLKPKEAQAFLKTYKDYVPMQKSFAIEGNESMRAVASDKSYANIDKMFKALSEEGSQRTVKDPMTQYAMNLQQLVSKIERNKVAKAVVKLSKTQGGAKLMTPVSTGGKPVGREQIVTVWDKGVQSSYQCHMPGLYDALVYADKATQAVQLNMLETLTQGAATTLRKGATSTWAFAMANMFKDLLNATTMNKDGRKTYLPIVDQAWLLVDGVLGKLDKQMMAEYNAQGVQYTTSIGSSRQINVNTRNYINDTSLKMSKMGKVIDKIMSVTDVGEQLPRIALYRRVRMRGGSPFEAAYVASDGTVNFMKSGSRVKTINRHIPFFNAVIQGDNKIWRSFKEDPVGTSFCAFTYLTMPALYCWSQNHDKEWYKNTPLSVKNKYYMLDMSSNKDGSLILKLPKNEFLGYMFASIPERILDFCVDNDRDGSMLSDSVKDTFGQLAPSGFPPSMLWLIEAQSGHSYFRNQPIVGERYKKLLPKDQYSLYTSEVAKGTANVLDKVGIKASPLIIDNTIYDLTGTMGYLVNGAIDEVVRKVNKDPVERPAKEWTEWTRFTHHVEGAANTRSSDVFYKGLERLEAEHGSAVKNAGKNPQPEVSEELKDMRRAKKKASDISAEIHQLDGMEMDGKTKRLKRNELVKARDDVYRFANNKDLGYGYVPAPKENPYPKKTKQKNKKYYSPRKSKKK